MPDSLHCIVFCALWGGGSKMKTTLFTIFALIFMCTCAYAGINDGLIGHWTFDSQANPGKDDSGNGHDGTLVGEPKLTQGRRFGALLFDGDDDSVEIGDIETLEFDANQEFTVSLWVMPVVNNTTYLFGKCPSSYWQSILAFPQNWSWNLYLHDSSLTFSVGDGTDHDTQAFYKIKPGFWHHVTVVVRG